MIHAQELDDSARIPAIVRMLETEPGTHEGIDAQQAMCEELGICVNCLDAFALVNAGPNAEAASALAVGVIIGVIAARQELARR